MWNNTDTLFGKNHTATASGTAAPPRLFSIVCSYVSYCSFLSHAEQPNVSYLVNCAWDCWVCFLGDFLLVFGAPRPPLWSSGQGSLLLNGDVLCFLWGTSWIYVCYVEESRPPLWSSDQGSWLLNGDVLCFLWGTNWIYISYVEESRPPLWSRDQGSWLLNGDVLCFLWRTNWIYIYYVKESRPPLCSGGQSSWL
jgi:hypothetical protein